MDEIIFKDSKGKTKMTLKGETLEIKDEVPLEDKEEKEKNEDSES